MRKQSFQHSFTVTRALNRDAARRRASNSVTVIVVVGFILGVVRFFVFDVVDLFKKQGKNSSRKKQK